MPDVYASIESADAAVQERVLEVGCVTRAVARTLALRPGVGEVVGLASLIGRRP
jgi:hypothetical protein